MDELTRKMLEGNSKSVSVSENHLTNLRSISADTKKLKATVYSQAKAAAEGTANDLIRDVKAAWKSRAAAVIMLGIFFIAVLFNTLFASAFRVTLNGETVGYVSSQDAYENALIDAEAYASELLGYEYAFDMETEYAFCITERNKIISEEHLRSIILNNVDELGWFYTVSVDGESIGVVENQEGIKNILDMMLEKYTTENTLEAGFLENVTINLEQSARDDVQGTKEVYDNIVNENLVSVATLSRISYTEEIAYETVRYDDDTMYEGYERVVTEGQAGALAVTADITEINGVKQTSTVVDTQVVINPIDEEVAVGTAARPEAVSLGEFIVPTSGTVTSYFGYRESTGSFHKGIDIAGEYGADIMAADGGVVTYADWMSGFGYLVIVQHDNGSETYYAHCSEMYVGVGEEVFRGQLIAAQGSTGRSSGVHLHFEIRVGGVSLDPMLYLNI